mmetsp:Transcript_35519/g.100531  ORF Transcript_35519/g.100531 Transcript_35519/m.100531 type:complete len:231 (+) Transcript_35519:540-1232(+)
MSLTYSCSAVNLRTFGNWLARRLSADDRLGDLTDPPLPMRWQSTDAQENSRGTSVQPRASSLTSESILMRHASLSSRSSKLKEVKRRSAVLRKGMARRLERRWCSQALSSSFTTTCVPLLPPAPKTLTSALATVCERAWSRPPILATQPSKTWGWYSSISMRPPIPIRHSPAAPALETASSVCRILCSRSIAGRPCMLPSASICCRLLTATSRTLPIRSTPCLSMAATAR